ncbi:MAG: pyridoxine 5'-phosphate synthase [Gemmatimonadetes bacterium]|nr:pyridoxine 5'-phosphate synthase [Gemmatimonadota bacterium]
MKPLRLYVNIDHVATLRQARRGDEPDPVVAARLCEDAGADGITAHLREDRRHVQDHDIDRLRSSLRTPLNLEMACTDEMVAIALRVNPHHVTLVPERREEVTTEGGLDVTRDQPRLRAAIARLQATGIVVSLFIDPDATMVTASAELGARAIELHTGTYCHGGGDSTALRALQDAASLGARLGLAVHAGHGLTTRNVGPVAAIPEVEELNIGHSIVSNAVYVGLPTIMRDMRQAMHDGRSRGAR